MLLSLHSFLLNNRIQQKAVAAINTLGLLVAVPGDVLFKSMRGYGVWINKLAVVEDEAGERSNAAEYIFVLNEQLFVGVGLTLHLVHHLN